MQFNPSLIYKGSDVSSKGSFPETKPEGLVTIPSCDPLIQDLRKRKSLIIPDKEENLTLLLRETLGDILEFAPRVSARWHGSTITITLHRLPVHCRMSVHCAGIPGLLYQEPLSGVQSLRGIDR